MNGALKKAFQEASQLPEDEQAEFAEWLLAELADERRWRKAFADSQDMLSAMADQALSVPTLSMNACFPSTECV